MKLILFLLLCFRVILFSDINLQQNYFVQNDTLLLSDIVTNPTQDKILYKTDLNKHSKRIKATGLLAKLKKYGYTKYNSKHPYIRFTTASPISVEKIKKFLFKQYTNTYKNIIIENISVYPRSYITSLPKRYEVKLQKRYYLSNRGVLYIKTEDKKKIFFNFNIRAKIDVYSAKNNIKKGVKISIRNTKKKSILLDKFRAIPLQNIYIGKVEAKYTLHKDTILTQRDIVQLNIIKRGAFINIFLNEQGLSMSIRAKALQNGQLHQIISVVTTSGKKIKVRVMGENNAQVQ